MHKLMIYICNTYCNFYIRQISEGGIFPYGFKMTISAENAQFFSATFRFVIRDHSAS